jgi:transcriptional regulator with XRE-family HTH domain
VLFTYRLWSDAARTATVAGVTPSAPSNVNLGHGVRRLRLARRLSIEALAGAAQMHPTYLSAIERGHRNPTWTKLCHLAEALDITISALARVAEAEVYGAAYTPLGEVGPPTTAAAGPTTAAAAPNTAPAGLSRAPAAAPTTQWRR